MSNLKKLLKSYIEKEDLPIYLFEKHNNLTQNLVYRLIEGSIKYPSVENLIKIADALGCSLDELVGRTSINKNRLVYPQQNTIQSEKDCDVGLFRSCCLYMIHYLDSHNITTPKRKNLQIALDELINHSQKNQLQTVDKKFADWSLSKLF